MSSKNYKMATWGAIYGLLAKRTTITATALGNIVSLPGENFSKYNSLAIKNMSQEDITYMGELVEDITTDDLRAGPVPPAVQGDFWLAFYKAGGATGPTGQRAGRPQAGEGISWSDVDWSLTNAEIARLKGCRPQSVAARRKKIMQEGVKYEQ